MFTIWKFHISFFNNRIRGGNVRSEASLARSKVWDWSMGSLQGALDRRVHPRAARFIGEYLDKNRNHDIIYGRFENREQARSPHTPLKSYPPPLEKRLTLFFDKIISDTFLSCGLLRWLKKAVTLGSASMSRFLPPLFLICRMIYNNRP